MAQIPQGLSDLSVVGARGGDLQAGGGGLARNGDGHCLLAPITAPLPARSVPLGSRCPRCLLHCSCVPRVKEARVVSSLYHEWESRGGSLF